MALGTVSVCLTVLTLNLHHRDPERNVPRWAKVLILNYLSKILCVRARKPKTMRAKALREQGSSAASTLGLRGGIRRIANDVNILRPMLNHTNNGEIDHYNSMNEQIYPNNKKEEKSDTSNNDWRELAHVLDRLFFWMVFVCMSASAMIILTVPLYREHKTKNS